MQLRVGQRIELVAMQQDPDPIASGTRGTVQDVFRVGDTSDGFVQVSVAWDNGRKLMLVVPPDRYRIVES